jgi:translation elongation factor EF-Ts
MSEKRADRDAKEGVVIAMVSPDNKKGIVVRLSCETDFVSKNEDFINLTKDIAQIALRYISLLTWRALNQQAYEWLTLQTSSNRAGSKNR